MCTNHATDEPTDQQAKEHIDSHSHNHNGARPHQDPGDLAECPVMPGNMVMKSEADADGMYRDYNGTRHYLCCDTCVADFDADPAAYANVA
jgi:YHS domain-containing protein